MRVYVVVIDNGLDYEDFHHWNFGVYTNRKHAVADAKREVNRLNREEDNWYKKHSYKIEAHDLQ